MIDCNIEIDKNHARIIGEWLLRKAMSRENMFCWVDIPVIDLDRAMAFYQLLLQVSIKKVYERGFVFGLLPDTPYNVSGRLAVMHDRQPSQYGALVYFNVAGRLEQAIKLAVEHGGTLLKRTEPFSPYGHCAVIRDTEGNAVALYSKEDRWPYL